MASSGTLGDGVPELVRLRTDPGIWGMNLSNVALGTPLSGFQPTS